MEIRKSTRSDLDDILKIYEIARKFMRENGNPTQWKNDRPKKESIISDIKKGIHYVIVDDGVLVGCFSFMIDNDPYYDYIEDGAWLNNELYGVIHKAASAQIKKGIMNIILGFCEAQASNIRIDTHKDNIVMQSILESHGYIKCGIIYVDDNTPRIAYQKIIKTL